MVNMNEVARCCEAAARARESARIYNTVTHADGSTHVVQSPGMDRADLDLWFAMNPEGGAK